jgi:dolichol kinase
MALLPKTEGEEMASLAQAEFWISQLVLITTLSLVAYGSGLLVIRHGIKVNYTRKINHFVIFFLPIFLSDVFPYEDTIATTLITTLIFVLALLALREPVRKRSNFISTAFASMDRPEDRPHTLYWVTTQIAAGYAVLLPLIYVFSQQGISELIYIPIFVNGIGDGLAEPVGVRFGRREYTVQALGSDRTYTRTVEGSACVFLVSLVVIVFFRDAFTSTQFWVALGVVPVAMTLAEARAPHTWDTPFLFLVGGLCLLAITAFL